MKKHEFFFRKHKILYASRWLDNSTFVFDFGDGEFRDEDGDDYFVHCEYHLDTHRFIFEIWWADVNQEANEPFISQNEKEYIKTFMMKLITEQQKF